MFHRDFPLFIWYVQKRNSISRISEITGLVHSSGGKKPPADIPAEYSWRQSQNCPAIDVKQPFLYNIYRDRDLSGGQEQSAKGIREGRESG